MRRILFIIITVLLASSTLAYFNGMTLSDNDNVYIAQENKLFSINNGQIAWQYNDESIIHDIVFIDWNNDFHKDIVIVSSSIIVPNIKIIDGANGNLLNSFSVTEESYAGKIPLPVNHVISNENNIFLSVGPVLYKIDHSGLKKINIFDGNINSLGSDHGQAYAETQQPQSVSRSYLNHNGDIIRTTSIPNQGRYVDPQFMKSVEKSNCPKQSLEMDYDSQQIIVSNLRLYPREIYCNNNYLYYLDSSNSLRKLNLNTNADTFLKNTGCSNEIVLINDKSFICGETLNINNKIVTLPSTTSSSLLSLSNEDSQFAIETVWPFQYYSKTNQGELNYLILKSSKVIDLSDGWDFDNDGKKEILINFADDRGTTGLLFFEKSTQQKHFVTLMLSESQISTKKSDLLIKLSNLNSSKDQKEQKFLRLEEDVNDKNNQLDNLNYEIDNLNRLRSNTDDADLLFDYEEQLDDLYGQRDNLINSVNNLNDDLSIAREDFYSLRGQINQLQSQLNEIASDDGRYIQSYDFCNDKLFLTSNRDVYSFSSTLSLKEYPDLYGNYLSCVNDQNNDGKKDLALFYDGISTATTSGNLIKKINTDIEFEWFNSAIKVRNNQKINLPIRSDDVVISTYDLNLKRINHNSYNFERVKSFWSNGKLFFCESNYDHNKVLLIDDQPIEFNLETSSNLGCDKISFADCDNDGKDELVVGVSHNSVLDFLCLNPGDSNLKSEDKNSGRYRSKQDSFVKTELVSNHFVVKNTFDQNEYRDPQVIEEPKFSYEVYDTDKKKILVSSEPVFYSNNGFVNIDNQKIDTKQLINGYSSSNNQVNLNFAMAGKKVIFVDGHYYDQTTANQFVVKLISGDHTVRTYLYDNGKYYLDEINVYVTQSSNFSIFSAIILFIFIMFIIFLITTRKL